MKRETVKMTALWALALAFALSTVRNAQAQDAKDPYPSMAPIEQYLMDRDAEIALARSAAPSSISRDAMVVILGKMATKRRSKARTALSALSSAAG